MREESHLDDMRAAIRGDFERLAERRGEQELMRVREEPAAEDERMVPVEEPPVEEAPPADDDPAGEEQEPPRSWLSRLLGG